MSRLIIALIIFLGMSFLADGKPSVNLGGDGGNSLFRDLTSNSTNNSLDFPRGNKSADNQTQILTAILLGGNDGSDLFENLTENSSFMGENDTLGNISTWGKIPRKAPIPKYDPKLAKTIEVLKQNHGM